MTHSRTLLLSALALASLLLFGCDSDPALRYETKPGQTNDGAASGPEDARVAINGVLVSGFAYPDDPVHEGPVTVQAGVPFAVKTVTFTGGCWEEVAPSVITTEGRTATVAVFDTWAYGDYFCQAYQSFTPRTDYVTLNEVGDGEVVVRGRRPNYRAETVEERYDVHELRFPVTVR